MKILQNCTFPFFKILRLGASPPKLKIKPLKIATFHRLCLKIFEAFAIGRGGLTVHLPFLAPRPHPSGPPYGSSPSGPWLSLPLKIPADASGFPYKAMLFLFIFRVFSVLMKN